MILPSASCETETSSSDWKAILYTIPHTIYYILYYIILYYIILYYTILYCTSLGGKGRLSFRGAARQNSQASTRNHNYML